MALFSKFSENARNGNAIQLYGAAMAQARQAAFYRELGVEDTPDGRLGLLSLHVILVLQRLTVSDAKDAHAYASAKISGLVLDRFVEDLDQAMRELGIGDMGVPKKIKKAMGQFYHYAKLVSDALANTDEGQAPNMRDLASHVSSLLPGIAAESTQSAWMAHYVVRTHHHLKDLSDQKLLRGAITFPPIEVVA